MNFTAMLITLNRHLLLTNSILSFHLDNDLVMKQALFNNLKNLMGTRTQRKIIVFSVDDYGNIRLDSKKARESMNKAGSKIYSRFDALDTLETKQDIEQLIEVLTSVKDKNGRSAVFTPFAMSCNIDFEAMEANSYTAFENENVDKSFEKLAALQPNAYEGAWDILREAIKNKIILPEYHGREHLNLKVFEEKLRDNDTEVLTALKNRSYTSIGDSGYSSISVTAAFNFWSQEDVNTQKQIAIDGAKRFHEVYGYIPIHFNAPGGRESVQLHDSLSEIGIKYIDTPWMKPEHLGKGVYKKRFYTTGKTNNFDQTFMVRNCIFEPNLSKGVSWKDYTLNQVEAAFRWKKPAIISSHRVNFCGHIDPQNRTHGLSELKSLLQAIVRKWPDVEFMSAPEAMDVLTKQNHCGAR